MRIKRILMFTLVVALLAVFAIYPINYYVMKPGGAYELAQFVDVQNGDTHDSGTMSLMTVSLAKATPLTYVIAKLKPFEEILDVDQVKRPDETEEEYDIRQLNLMSNSQFNAINVAFQKENLPVNVEYNGVFILSILKGSSADGVLRAGDRVTGLDGIKMERQKELVGYLADKKSGDQVEVVFIRDNKEQSKVVTLKPLPGDEKRVGLGITFSENKRIETTPEVKIQAEDIGGPSAGLMFTLQIIDKLNKEDLTKGYKIAGTGEMLEDGTVGRIGGIDKKVVAADDAGIEIFFAPDDDIPDEVKRKNPTLQSNYAVAVETAEKIGTKMKIVPVKSVNDALAYLAKLEPKK